MVKCLKCSKVVNKNNPGVQCSKCNKWLHANGTCSPLTDDQLKAMAVTDSIDWKCKNCQGGAKPKRISCILPDAEDEESDMEQGIYEKNKILNIFRMEIRDIISAELRNTLDFYSQKIDDYEMKIKDFEMKLKTVENQCEGFKNSCKNLILQNEVLEQKLNKIEQNQSSNKIEICGIDEHDGEDVKNTELISTAFRRKKMYRAGNSSQANRANSVPAPIVVSLRDDGHESWLATSKNKRITLKDVIGGDKSGKVYIRESLTSTTAYLLWKTKTTLRNNNICKYVWCKNGQILVRKQDDDKKVHIVRTASDIDRIAKILK